MIPPGKYIVKAIDHKFSTTSNGTERVGVKLQIQEGPQVNQSAWWDGYLTEKTEARTAEALVHLGWTGEEFTKLPGLGSTQAIAVFERDDYNGQERTRVRWINSLDGAPRVDSAMDPEAARGFASRMEALARGVKKPENSPSAGQPVYADEDPEIPF